jgi:hypothetical protein
MKMRGFPVSSATRPKCARCAVERQRLKRETTRVESSAISGYVSHTRAVPSSDAVTTRRPSALNDADFTAPSCPSSTMPTGRDPDRSHTRAVPSLEAVTTRPPSALNDAAVTGPACPSSTVAAGRGPDRSHTRAVWSADAVTTRRPSGLNDAANTASVCPSSTVSTGRGPDRSHTRAVPSWDAVTTRPPTYGSSTAIIFYSKNILPVPPAEMSFLLDHMDQSPKYGGFLRVSADPPPAGSCGSGAGRSSRRHGAQRFARCRPDQ